MFLKVTSETKGERSNISKENLVNSFDVEVFSKFSKKNEKHHALFCVKSQKRKTFSII